MSFEGLGDDDKGKIYDFELTKGEVRAWDRLYAIETAHNAIAEQLTMLHEQFIEYRNTFVDELCRKYGIPAQDRGKITFDRVTRRFVSVNNPGLRMFVQRLERDDMKKFAAGLIQTGSKELISMYLQTDELAREHAANG